MVKVKLFPNPGMAKSRMHRKNNLTPLLVIAFAAISGCAHSGAPMGQSTPAFSSGGYTHGMPPSSQGPSPTWYAQRINRPRGIGEAVKQSHLSLWDRDTGTFVYYIGGELYAQYHPWEHYLQIRTDNKDETNTVCRWAENGTLTISRDSGDKVPAPAGEEGTCKQLLDQLEKHVAPSGILSSGPGAEALPTH